MKGQPSQRRGIRARRRTGSRQGRYGSRGGRNTGGDRNTRASRGRPGATATLGHPGGDRSTGGIPGATAAPGTTGGDRSTWGDRKGSPLLYHGHHGLLDGYSRGGLMPQIFSLMLQ